eukprot:5304979-Prymnesium_polylepis.1
MLPAFGAHKTKSCLRRAQNEKLRLANTTSKWCSYWRRDPLVSYSDACIYSVPSRSITGVVGGRLAVLS